MRILTRELSHPSRKDTFRVYFLTDLHIGARACDEARLAADVSRIQQDARSYWIGGGDYLDAITRKDPRHFERTYAEWVHGQDDIVQHQLDHCLGLLAPICDRCLGLVCGNHERAILRHYDRDVYAAVVRGVAERGQQPPETLLLGTCGFVRLDFVRKQHARWPVTIYCHHGYSGGRLKGAKALNLERLLTHVRADMVLMGHVHDLVFTSKVVLDPKGQHETRFGAFVPGYLKSHEAGYDSYAEDHGYFPTSLGTFPIEITPAHQQFRFCLENS